MTQKFEPFQRVLVRDNDNQEWHCSIFSNIEERNGVEGTIFKYRTIESVWYQCIPYEGNENLLGTKDSPTPPDLEFKFGDKVIVSYDGENWSKAIYIREVDGNCPYEVLKQVPYHKGGYEFHAKFCHHEDW